MKVLKTALLSVAVTMLHLGSVQAGDVKPSDIKEHMQVTGSDGTHVGTVDEIRGDRIVLMKEDPSSGGTHHSIPVAMAQKISDKKVMLNVDAAKAKSEWQVAARR